MKTFIESHKIYYEKQEKKGLWALDLAKRIHSAEGKECLDEETLSRLNSTLLAMQSNMSCQYDSFISKKKRELKGDRLGLALLPSFEQWIDNFDEEEEGSPGEFSEDNAYYTDNPENSERKISVQESTVIKEESKKSTVEKTKIEVPPTSTKNSVKKKRGPYKKKTPEEKNAMKIAGAKIEQLLMGASEPRYESSDRSLDNKCESSAESLPEKNMDRKKPKKNAAGHINFNYAEQNHDSDFSDGPFKNDTTAMRSSRISNKKPVKDKIRNFTTDSALQKPRQKLSDGKSKKPISVSGKYLFGDDSSDEDSDFENSETSKQTETPPNKPEVCDRLGANHVVNNQPNKTPNLQLKLSEETPPSLPIGRSIHGIAKISRVFDREVVTSSARPDRKARKDEPVKLGARNKHVTPSYNVKEIGTLMRETMKEKQKLLKNNRSSKSLATRIPRTISSPTVSKRRMPLAIAPPVKSKSMPTYKPTSQELLSSEDKILTNCQLLDNDSSMFSSSNSLDDKTVSYNRNPLTEQKSSMKATNKLSDESMDSSSAKDLTSLNLLDDNIASDAATSASCSGYSNEARSTEEDASAKEPGSTEEAMSTKESTRTKEFVCTEVDASTEMAANTEEAASTKVAANFEEAVNTEETASTKEAASDMEAGSAMESASPIKDANAKEAASTKEPRSTEEYVSPEDCVSTEEPESTKETSSTEEAVNIRKVSGFDKETNLPRSILMQDSLESPEICKTETQHSETECSTESHEVNNPETRHSETEDATQLVSETSKLPRQNCVSDDVFKESSAAFLKSILNDDLAMSSDSEDDDYLNDDLRSFPCSSDKPSNPCSGQEVSMSAASPRQPPIALSNRSSPVESLSYHKLPTLAMEIISPIKSPSYNPSTDSAEISSRTSTPMKISSKESISDKDCGTVKHKILSLAIEAANVQTINEPASKVQGTYSPVVVVSCPTPVSVAVDEIRGNASSMDRRNTSKSDISISAKKTKAAENDKWISIRGIYTGLDLSLTDDDSENSFLTNKTGAWTESWNHNTEKTLTPTFCEPESSQVDRCKENCDKKLCSSSTVASSNTEDHSHGADGKNDDVVVSSICLSKQSTYDKTNFTNTDSETINQRSLDVTPANSSVCENSKDCNFEGFTSQKKVPCTDLDTAMVVEPTTLPNVLDQVPSSCRANIPGILGRNTGEKTRRFSGSERVVAEFESPHSYSLRRRSSCRDPPNESTPIKSTSAQRSRKDSTKKAKACKQPNSRSLNEPEAVAGDEDLISPCDVSSMETRVKIIEPAQNSFSDDYKKNIRSIFDSLKSPDLLIEVPNFVLPTHFSAESKSLVGPSFTEVQKEHSVIQNSFAPSLRRCEHKHTLPLLPVVEPASIASSSDVDATANEMVMNQKPLDTSYPLVSGNDTTIEKKFSNLDSDEISTEIVAGSTKMTEKTNECNDADEISTAVVTESSLATETTASHNFDEISTAVVSGSTLTMETAASNNAHEISTAVLTESSLTTETTASHNSDEISTAVVTGSEVISVKIENKQKPVATFLPAVILQTQQRYRLRKKHSPSIYSIPLKSKISVVEREHSKSNVCDLGNDCVESVPTEDSDNVEHQMKNSPLTSANNENDVPATSNAHEHYASSENTENSISLSKTSSTTSQNSSSSSTVIQKDDELERDQNSPPIVKSFPPARKTKITSLDATDGTSLSVKQEILVDPTSKASRKRKAMVFKSTKRVIIDSPPRPVANFRKVNRETKKNMKTDGEKIKKPCNKQVQQSVIILKKSSMHKLSQNKVNVKQSGDASLRSRQSTTDTSDLDVNAINEETTKADVDNPKSRNCIGLSKTSKCDEVASADEARQLTLAPRSQEMNVNFTSSDSESEPELRIIIDELTVEADFVKCKSGHENSSVISPLGAIVQEGLTIEKSNDVSGDLVRGSENGAGSVSIRPDKKKRVIPDDESLEPSILGQCKKLKTDLVGHPSNELKPVATEIVGTKSPHTTVKVGISTPRQTAGKKVNFSASQLKELERRKSMSNPTSNIVSRTSGHLTPSNFSATLSAAKSKVSRASYSPKNASTFAKTLPAAREKKVNMKRTPGLLKSAAAAATAAARRTFVGTQRPHGSHMKRVLPPADDSSSDELCIKRSPGKKMLLVDSDSETDDFVSPKMSSSTSSSERFAKKRRISSENSPLLNSQNRTLGSVLDNLSLKSVHVKKSSILLGNKIDSSRKSKTDNPLIDSPAMLDKLSPNYTPARHKTPLDSDLLSSTSETGSTTLKSMIDPHSTKSSKTLPKHGCSKIEPNLRIDVPCDYPAVSSAPASFHSGPRNIAPTSALSSTASLPGPSKKRDLTDIIGCSADNSPKAVNSGVNSEFRDNIKPISYFGKDILATTNSENESACDLHSSEESSVSDVDDDSSPQTVTDSTELYPVLKLADPELDTSRFEDVFAEFSALIETQMQARLGSSDWKTGVHRLVNALQRRLAKVASASILSHLRPVARAFIEAILEIDPLDDLPLGARALCPMLYKLFMLAKLIEANVSTVPAHALEELITSTCESLICNSGFTGSSGGENAPTLSAASVASLCAWHTASCCVAKKGDRKPQWQRSRCFIVNVLCHYPGSAHAALLASLFLARFVFLRVVKYRSSTGLERVIIWLVHHGEWIGKRSVRKLLIENMIQRHSCVSPPAEPLILVRSIVDSLLQTKNKAKKFIFLDYPQNIKTALLGFEVLGCWKRKPWVTNELLPFLVKVLASKNQIPASKLCHCISIITGAVLPRVGIDKDEIRELLQKIEDGGSALLTASRFVDPKLQPDDALVPKLLSALADSLLKIMHDQDA
ncbi:uncharacterized protein LOC108679863 isoform X2 [Hyalella azteca]|uniref:Uncharacterized protein LOC108679863 isoform X2 n=1 Tax=Hyalella azteca TaxID=294128 RepID=A0A8B7PDB8_HYAAZ|nr:uncharacterized protein LOC108679863 isoform X2 [Hyalella azteca]